MDRTILSTLTRVSGGTALGALLLYGGMALATSDLGAGTLSVIVLVTLLGTILATWSLTRLEVSEAAPWVAAILVGVAPVAAFLGWILSAELAGLMGALLWVNLIAGAVTLALTVWTAYSEPTEAGARPYGLRVG